MARGRSRLRPGIWTVTVAAWNIWRRLPPKQRKQVLGLARKHGPKLAAKAVQATRKKR